MHIRSALFHYECLPYRWEVSQIPEGGSSKPLLRKPALDLTELSNYRPVPDTLFLDKTPERMAVAQLQGFLN